MNSPHLAVTWIAFLAILAGLLVLDLAILNRRAHVPSIREAAAWSGGLVLLAAAFAGWLWWHDGHARALEFGTGYVVELSLSVDNLFVFILLFRHFAVPPALQPKVLKWGIFGAMVMRGIMIAAGTLMLRHFSWVTLLFGGVLIVTGLRMFRDDPDRPVNPERHFVVRWARRLLPLDPRYHGARFITRKAPRVATLLFLVLVVVEWTDLVFAIDSIPAVFAVTRDPFVVYSSNIFAILGLRAMYFLLAGMLNTFRYLKPGIALILVAIGGKMAASRWVDISTVASLAGILVILGISVLASLRHARTTVTALER